jgi:hypothetical protein
MVGTMVGTMATREREREDVFTAKLMWCAEFARCVHSNEDRVLSANSQPSIVAWTT